MSANRITIDPMASSSGAIQSTFDLPSRLSKFALLGLEDRDQVLA